LKRVYSVQDRLESTIVVVGVEGIQLAAKRTNAVEGTGPKTAF
jgi:hypothetical protein